MLKKIPTSYKNGSVGINEIPIQKTGHTIIQLLFLEIVVDNRQQEMKNKQKLSTNWTLILNITIFNSTSKPFVM